LFLDFYIAHIVIEIRMRALSESLFRSSSNDSAAIPFIRPVDMLGHVPEVVFRQMDLAVPGLDHCFRILAKSWIFALIEGRTFSSK